MRPHAVERRDDSLADVGIGHVIERLEEIFARGGRTVAAPMSAVPLLQRSRA
jgi:hypothetical protein